MGRIIPYIMENKTCLKPPTRTYILKKINVESTKVHKVVKLEKKCWLCSTNPHREHFYHWKDLTAVRPCRRWWFFQICLHQLWGLGSKSIKPYNEPMMGTQIPLEEHFTGHVVRWSVWRANAAFAIHCLKPAQETFQIKTCWGWFTRMLWKLYNIKHKQKYINNNITHIIRYDNYIILYIYIYAAA